MEKKMSKEREFIEGIQGFVNGVAKHTPTIANGVIKKHKNNPKVVNKVHGFAAGIFNLKNLLDDVRQVMIEEENDEQKRKDIERTND